MTTSRRYEFTFTKCGQSSRVIASQLGTLFLVKDSHFERTWTQDIEGTTTWTVKGWVETPVQLIIPSLDIYGSDGVWYTGIITEAQWMLEVDLATMSM